MLGSFGTTIVSMPGFNGIAAINILNAGKFKIRDLYIDNQAATFGVLFNDGAENAELQNVEVKGAQDDGIAVSGARAKHIKLLRCAVHDVQSLGPGTRAGIEIDGPEVEDVEVRRCRAWHNGNGLSIHTHQNQISPRGVKVLDSVFWNNIFPATGAHNQQVEIDMYNDKDSVAPRDIEIARCYMQGGVNAMRVIGCKDVRAHDCVIINMSGYAVQVISEWLGDGGNILMENFRIEDVGDGIIVPAPFEPRNGVKFVNMRMSRVRGQKYIVQPGVEIGG